MANTNLECAAMVKPMITSNMHGCMEDVFAKKKVVKDTAKYLFA